MVALTPLETAVATALSQDPTVGRGVRAEAQSVCDAFQRDPEAWKVACHQFLHRSKFTDADVNQPGFTSGISDCLLGIRFWYIQVIANRVPTLNAEERADVRTFLLVYLDEVLPWRSTVLVSSTAASVQAKSGAAAADNPAVVAKLALLYIRCLVADYPETWPEGISSLLSIWSKHRDAHRRHAAADNRLSRNSPEVDQAVSKLICLQKYLTLTQFFLSVMEIFDDEIVNEGIARSQKEKNRNMAIKDALREGDILRLVEAWEQILLDFKACGDEGLLPLQENNVVSRCLETLAKFVAWVDIQILANEKFLGIAYSLLDRKYRSAPAAMEFIGAIARKKMDPAQRIVMFHKLGIIDQLFLRSAEEHFARAVMENGIAEGAHNNAADYMTDPNCSDPDLDFLKLCDLLNLIAEQVLAALVELRKECQLDSTISTAAEGGDVRLTGGVKSVGPNPFFTPITSIEFWRHLQEESWNMQNRLLPRVCSVFSHPHPRVAESVAPFLSEFFKNLRSFLLYDNGSPSRSTRYPAGSALSPLYVPVSTIRPVLQSLLQMSLSRVQFPFWFDFSRSADNQLQESFLEFRKEISLLFKRLYAVDETISQLFLQDVCRRLQSAMSQRVYPQQIEAALHLIVLAGETYPDISKQLTSYDHPIAESLRLLFSNQQLLRYPHAQIRILLFQLVIRFMPFIQSKSLHPPGSNYMAAVLDLLLTSSGIKVVSQESSNRDLVKAVASAATVTLQRLIKPNLATLGSSAEGILTEFCQSELLTVKYFPSKDWPLEQPTTTTTAIIQQRDVSSSAKNPPPSGFPDEALNFDDQNRCYEIFGVLISSPSLPMALEQRLFLLGKLVDPLLIPLEELQRSIESGSSSSSSSLLQYRADPLGCVDFVARLLQACGNLCKGLRDGKLSKFGSRLLMAELIALQHFGLDSRIRSAVLLLSRPLIPMFQTSPEVTSDIRRLVQLLFDLTMASVAQSSSINECVLVDCLRREFKDDLEYNQAIVDLNGAVQRIRNSNAGFNLSSFSFSFSIHQDVPQLCVFLVFIIVSLKGDLANNEFLLFKVPGFSPNTQICLFSRLFNQIVDYWRVMPTDSPELLREKNDVRRDIHSTVHSMAQHSPSTLFRLLEIESSNSSPDYRGLTPILSWLVSGVYPNPVQASPAAAVCIQAWTSLLDFLLNSTEIAEKAANNEISMEVLLFDQLKFALFMRNALQLSFLLDMRNPQHGKILQEFCALLRLFSSTVPESDEGSTSSWRCNLRCRLQYAFVQSVPSSSCSIQDAALVIKAVSETRTTREAKDVLQTWIGTQQLAARPSEETS